MRRLYLIGEQAAHPLFMPVILAEIELARQRPLVETRIVAMETRIMELDTVTPSPPTSPSSELLQKRVNNRIEWLDLVYLRDSLITWTKQMEKMVKHGDEM